MRRFGGWRTPRSLAGYVAVGSGQEANMETNFGVRSRPIRWLYLATREVFWRVTVVDPQEGDDAETFCAVVPGKHEFTLAGGISTANCGACEPDARSRRSFRRTRCPRNGSRLSRSTTRSSGGFDVVNTFANEYATEHNVQNEPIE